MKKINKFGIGAALLMASTLLNTSCIDETQPTGSVLEEQIQKSNTAAENLLMGIPAYFNKFYFSARYDWAFGYGAIMHIRDVETADLLRAQSNYDQFSYFAQNRYMGKDYVFSQYLWGYQYKFVNQANTFLTTVKEEGATADQLAYRSAAYAFRALMYLDMAREYEFLPNDKFTGTNEDGNDVKNLTVPIVTDATTEEQARNNPRATRDEMAAFILSDLQKAEEHIGDLSNSDHVLPHLDCVYGLYARYYMWLENYPKAREYARKAINAATTAPMTQSAALNTAAGFNDVTQWMWGAMYTKEALESNLSNWTSFLSNETNFGYAGGGGVTLMINSTMYDQIGNNDWRKLLWKAPQGSVLDGKNTYADATIGENLPEYASLKFRPGQGNTTTYSVACIAGYPIMRVEEMYFIEAEAAARENADEGKALLENFMKLYRDPTYSVPSSVASQEDLVDEILFQKRVELWGEGQTFFDIKRTNMPVTRSGANYQRQNEIFNTTTRPAWMNWVIISTEEDGNKALNGYNNPDPTDAYRN